MTKMDNLGFTQLEEEKHFDLQDNDSNGDTVSDTKEGLSTDGGSDTREGLPPDASDTKEGLLTDASDGSGSDSGNDSVDVKTDGETEGRNKNKTNQADNKVSPVYSTSKKQRDRALSVTISEDGSKHWRNEYTQHRRSVGSFGVDEVFLEDDEELENEAVTNHSGAGSWGGDNLTEYSYSRLPFKEKLKQYITSYKGRQLTQGVSLGYALCFSITCFAIVMSIAISENSISNAIIKEFLLIMYTTGSLVLLLLLLLGMFNKLSRDEKYKNQKSTSFIRAGMIGLGTGGFLYRAIVIGGYIISGDCDDVITFGNAAMGFIFTLLQMAFLVKYSKIEINKSCGLSIAARFMLMHVVATNLCLWVSVIIEETLLELALTDTTDGDGGGQNVTEAAFMAADSRATSGDTCQVKTDLQNILTPYLFPLLIEFCVVASTMLIAIWEKTGDGASDDAGSRRTSSVSQGTLVSARLTTEHQAPSDGHHEPQRNSYTGFVFGWIIIIFSIATTLFCLYALYTDVSYVDDVDELIYGASLAIGSLSLLVLPHTVYRMSTLTFKDDEIRRVARGYSEHAHRRRSDVSKLLERHLLSVTFFAVLAYRILSAIAAVSDATPEYVMFADSIIAIMMSGTQTMFCNWFAFHKRSTLEEHLHERPGFQGLSFLRCTNFALWLLNTVLLKDRHAKEDQIEVFGETGWAILSNIFQPLAILFYFHSFICTAEIIHRSYTRKYIGIFRESKIKRASRSVSRATSASSVRMTSSPDV